ncbi:MAG TPA: RsmG family class I SAM-dependent methyltransferase [Candidatus Binataceae bacterium]|nr:RsmG family class I SAM-dependent methyltransferase [Candidatus Binataceae bacterium]
MFHVKLGARIVADSFHANSAAIGDGVAAILRAQRATPSFDVILDDQFISRACRFAALLAHWGSRVNLTAAPDRSAEIAFHILDSLAPLLGEPGALLAPSFGAGRAVLDIGSGAGFPGLILASLCHARFVLTEARRRRASFLSVCATELKLANVQVNNQRMTPQTVPSGFDVALTRAVSGPEFYPLAARALKPGALALIYSTPAQRLDLAAACRAGLASYQRFSYLIPRAGRAQERALACWMREKTSPD